MRIEPGYNPIDVAIVLDLSGSNGCQPGAGTQGHQTGNAFATQFVQQIDPLLNGSLTNAASPQNSVQVGLGVWTADPFTAACGNCSGAAGSRGTVVPMTTDSTLLNSTTTNNAATDGFGQPVQCGAGDEYDDAIDDIQSEIDSLEQTLREFQEIGQSIVEKNKKVAALQSYISSLDENIKKIRLHEIQKSLNHHQFNFNKNMENLFFSVLITDKNKNNQFYWLNEKL